MLVSEKQQSANRRNAQHSTGPKTPEGKAAVCLNALKYGLRARNLLILGEDPEEYKQLWASLEAEWQPQTPTERLYLEQMCTSQWLIARFTGAESTMYWADIPSDKKYGLLAQAGQQRSRLERSFTSALHELKQLQKERRQQQTPQPPRVQPRQARQSKQPLTPPPAYVMSDATEDHPSFCANTAPDSR